MDKRIWSFELSAYEELQTKVSALNPQVVIGQLPKFVLKLLKEGNIMEFKSFFSAEFCLLLTCTCLSFHRTKGARFFVSTGN